MTPVHFGQAGELFGFFHSPTGENRNAAAVVLCGSHGDEMVCTHRTLRELARRLAALGFSVLRFDYHGVGDSLGCDRDPERVSAWSASIAQACDEALRRSGASHLHIFGVRIGALLAPGVASDRTDVASLVLWSPITRGRVFVRELQALNAMSAGAEWEVKPTPALAEGDAEAGGFLLAKETVADLGRIDLLKLTRAPAKRMLLIGRDDLPIDEPLIKHFAALGAEVEQRVALGYAGMMTSRHNAKLPVKVIDQVCDWLTSLEPTFAAATPPLPCSPSTTRDDRGGFAETAFHFGSESRSFGVLTTPISPTKERPAIVMLTIGANPHFGSNGMYVRWARNFSALGFSSLRFDISGIGESEAAPGEAPIQPYPKAAAADIDAALVHLRQKGHKRFVLIGLCSGGYHAFKTAIADPSVVATMIINAQTFDFREGDTLDVTRAHWDTVSAAEQYKKSLFSVDKWKKVLRGGVNLRSVFNVVSARAMGVVKARLARFSAEPKDEGRGAFAGEFEKLCKRGTDVFMVFSTKDPGLDYLNLHAMREIEALAGNPKFKFVEISGPDHTFTPMWSQVELERLVVERLALL